MLDVDYISNVLGHALVENIMKKNHNHFLIAVFLTNLILKSLNDCIFVIWFTNQNEVFWGL